MQPTQSRPKFLDSLVSNHRLTPDGKEWLTLALDPFHDMEHQAAGYPDADGSQTLVSCYQYQTDLSAPAGVVGNWDCQINTNPFSSTSTMAIATQLADWSSLSINNPFVSFGSSILQITSVPTGQSVYPVAPAVANTAYAQLPALNNTDLVDGVTRILAIGFEVINTTATINKQGAVTCYRMPQYISDVGTTQLRNAPGTALYNPTIQRVRMPPMTVAQANLLKGTRTWDASAGVYAVAAQNAITNPLKTANNTMLVVDPSAGTGAVAGVHYSSFTSLNVNVSPAVSGCAPTPTKTIPYDTTGAIFTGLSNETTLTVKLRVFVERAPTWMEPNLAVLATPSAGYDPVALELYAYAISHLPVAVTVSENGAGDWFRAVVRALKDVAGPLTNFLGPIVPGATQMGSAAQSVLGKMDAWLNNNRSQPSVSRMSSEKPRKKPQSAPRVTASQSAKKKTKVRPGPRK